MIEPKSEAIRTLYWRSEILQVMFWLRGEGFGDLMDPPLLERFLGVDAAIGTTYLDRLVEEGYVVRDGDWYALSDRGLEEGSLEFASSFAELTRPTHGECSDDCWCHASADEAAACAATRDEPTGDERSRGEHSHRPGHDARHDARHDAHHDARHAARHDQDHDQR